MPFWVHMLDILFPPRATEARVRSLSNETWGSYLSPEVCTLSESAISFLFPYRIPDVQAVIKEAKFHKNARAVQFLSSSLSDYLFSLTAEDGVFSPIVLVPIPLSKKRERRRGYNQVLRILKDACGEASHMSLAPTILSRTRDTRPQTTLSRKERLHNMKGAFHVNKPLDTHTHYLVVDDVVTTGATMREAMSALRKAGATHVSGLALAH